MINVIYKIINMISRKYYIGSAVNYRSRFRSHTSKLNRNVHENPYLQNAWNKNGEHNFKFEIIEVCGLNNLLEREQYYIDTLKPAYNLCLIAGNKKGISASPAARAKMSLSQKLRFQDETQKINRNLILKGNNFRKGKKASEKTKLNISLGHMGHLVSEATREKIRAAHKGKKKSPEHIAKIQASRKLYFQKLKEVA